MCAPHDDQPVTIELTRREWGEVAAEFDKLPAVPAEDPPGLVRLFETLGEKGLIESP